MDDNMLLPIVVATLTSIFTPIFVLQIIVTTQLKNISLLQACFLFSLPNVAIAFVGVYQKHKAERQPVSYILMLSTGGSAVTCLIASFLSYDPGFLTYVIWSMVMLTIGIFAFFSQLSCLAILSRISSRKASIISLLDLGLLFSALSGCLLWSIGEYTSGTLLLTTFVLTTNSASLITFTDNSLKIELESVMDIEGVSCLVEAHEYENDERIRSDISKSYSKLLQYDSNFAKNMIDTDAQSIILIYVTYTIIIAISQGTTCMFLLGLPYTMDITPVKLACIYCSGIGTSCAVTSLTRPHLVCPSSNIKVLAIAVIIITNNISFYVLSDFSSSLTAFIIAFSVITTNSHLFEDIVEGVITTYYNSLPFPAFQCFSVTDYIASKVGFMNGCGCLLGCLVVGLMCGDDPGDVDNVFFALSVTHFTFSIILLPLSTLFIVYDLR